MRNIRCFPSVPEMVPHRTVHPYCNVAFHAAPILQAAAPLPLTQPQASLVQLAPSANTPHYTVTIHLSLRALSLSGTATPCFLYLTVPTDRPY